MTVFRGVQCPLCLATNGQDHHPRCDEDRAQRRSLGMTYSPYDPRTRFEDEADEDDYSENSYP